MNGKLPVSRDTFVTEENPVTHKKHLYDTLEFMVRQQGAFIEKCDGKFQKMEGRKIINTAAAAGGGFFGGVAAVVGKWFIFK